jgi:Carboxypeptidase regulatory-like domain/Domain of unknown function (DUF4382)
MVSRLSWLAPVLGIVSVAACSGHNVSTSTPHAGATKAYLIDAPFPYDQVARVDIYFVSVVASSNPDTLGIGGPGSIATPHRAYNLLELGNGSAAKLGEGLLFSGQYVQFFITIDTDSSSITLKDGRVLTRTTSPGINWGGPSRQSFGLFTDPPVQVTDTGAVVIVDFDLGRSFSAIDPANAGAGFNYIGYIQVRNSAVTGSVTGTVMAANAGPIADASITLVGNGSGVFGTARTDATGQFRLPYASPGTYALAVEAPATSPYGVVQLPTVAVSIGRETQVGTVVVPHK